jgi:hypothetical protein
MQRPRRHLRLLLLLLLRLRLRLLRWWRAEWRAVALLRG